MKFALISALAVSTIALAACSQRSQDASANAADSIAADTNATTRKAVDDVNAASDRALGAAQNAIDDARPSANHAADSIDRGIDRASNATGNALERAGHSLKN